MKLVLISTYELGRQPFGLASPAAWLHAQGHEVVTADLAVQALPAAAVREAALVAFFLPMHTATRLAAAAIERVKRLNPSAHLCCYGLYAPLNETYLRGLGVRSILGGEFEKPLAGLVDRVAAASSHETGTDSHFQMQEMVSVPVSPAPAIVSVDRQEFLAPDRTGLPPLSEYAHLHINGERKTVGYTEASRGCKHLCRHCPIVPVYQGRFRIVPPEVVLEDVRRQVAAGAEHITFGDPDFLNGPAHAVRIVTKLHEEFPRLSYDVTAKVEHLLRHAGLLPLLRETGCLFVTTAVESLEDEVLARLEKGHTRQDFVDLVGACRAAGLTLAPTFIPFTPWTTVEGYRDLLRVLAELDLVDNVSPVQLGLRLLITSNSRLLELEDIRAVAGPFDEAALVYPWKHPDPKIDELGAAVLNIVKEQASRRKIFAALWRLLQCEPLPENFHLMPRATVPFLEEPWYC